MNYKKQRRTLGRPERPCRRVGCVRTTNNQTGYCNPCTAAHQKQTDAKRPSSRERGYTRQWQHYRREFLANPKHKWCVRCLDQGRRRESTVVDHIVDHKGDPAVFADPKNHQGLCKRCHDSKTGRAAREARKS